TLAVAVVYIPTHFRLVRGQTLSIKEEVYVEAARAIGARRGTILSRYIFPNVIATVVVILSLNIADAIMTEAALSYIGLGLPAGIPDWGMDLSMGKKFLPSGVWWMITFPGLMIMLLALGFTMLGEGLAEILKLQRPPGRVTGAKIMYRGNDILSMSDHALLKMRGQKIAMIFQNPLTS